MNPLRDDEVSQINFMIYKSPVVYCKKIRLDQEPLLFLEDLFQKMGGLPSSISSGDIVFIKPNFVAPFEKVTTDLRFIDFFISKIREVGAIPVIGESSGFEFDTEATFEVLGAKKFAEDRGVRLINLEKESFSRIDLNGFGTVEISKVALEAKYIINLSVLKGHTITTVTGAVKNFMGLLSKRSRRFMHFYRLKKGIAALAKKFENAIHFVDARYLLTRPVFSENRGFLGYCLAGLNPFTLDHYGSQLLGINPKSVSYLKGISNYTVEGERPGDLPPLDHKLSTQKYFFRFLYAVSFWIDEMKCSLMGGHSIVPYLHWYLGIHPKIGVVTKEELVKLSLLCPVGAIDKENKKIVKDHCIRVRCLKCYRESLPGKILLKGRGIPKGI